MAKGQTHHLWKTAYVEDLEERALEYARRLLSLREAALALLNHDTTENRQALWREIHTDGSGCAP